VSFVWTWVTLSDLAKYSMIRSITRSLRQLYFLLGNIAIIYVLFEVRPDWLTSQLLFQNYETCFVCVSMYRSSKIWRYVVLFEHRPCCSWQMYDDVLSLHRLAENTNCLLFWSYEMTAKRRQSSLWSATWPPAKQIQFTTTRMSEMLSHDVAPQCIGMQPAIF